MLDKVQQKNVKNASSESLTALAKTLGQSFLYNSIQTPLNGTVQLYDHLTDSHVLDQVQFFKPVLNIKKGTAQFYANYIGSGIGSAADFIALGLVSKSLLASSDLGFASSDAKLMSMSLNESALTGALYGGIFSPNNPRVNDFYLNRVENSLGNALTFTAMTASSIGLSKIGAQASSDIARSVLNSKITNILASSSVGGILQSQTNDLINYHKFAGIDSMAKSTLSMSLFGLGMSSLSDHLSRFSDLNSLKLVSSDSAELSKQSNISVDRMKINRQIEKINLDLKGQKFPNDLQNAVYNHLKLSLKNLQNSGDISADWHIIPTQASSPLDMIGCDYLLLNIRNGDLHFLDGTSNTQKAENPSSFNVPAIRQDGLVYFEPKWFDTFGKLAIDYDKSGKPIIESDRDIAIHEFKQKTDNQLIELTSTRSLFNLAKNPLPSLKIQTPEVSKTEIDNFINWLNNQALSNTQDRQLYSDYARTLKRATQHIQIEAAIKNASPAQTLAFAAKAQSASDSAVYRFVIDKLLSHNPNHITSTRGLSDVRYQPKQGELNMIMPDSTRLQSPKVEVLLDNSLKKMFDPEYLMNHLIDQNGKFTKTYEELNKQYPNMPIKTLISKIQSTVIECRNQISNGGITGTGEPIIINNIVHNLRARSINELTK